MDKNRGSRSLGKLSSHFVVIIDLNTVTVQSGRATDSKMMVQVGSICIYMTVPSGRETDSKMMMQVGSICIYMTVPSGVATDSKMMMQDGSICIYI